MLKIFIIWSTIEDSFFLVSDIDEDSIYRISLSDDELKSLGINSIGRPIGLTYNEEKKKIYWSDANIGIKTATLSGESAGIVLIVSKLCFIINLFKRTIGCIETSQCF